MADACCTVLIEIRKKLTEICSQRPRIDEGYRNWANRRFIRPSNDIYLWRCYFANKKRKRKGHTCAFILLLYYLYICLVYCHIENDPSNLYRLQFFYFQKWSLPHSLLHQLSHNISFFVWRFSFLIALFSLYSDFRKKASSKHFLKKGDRTRGWLNVLAWTCFHSG